MKNKKVLSLLLTGAMTAALLAVPAQAEAAPPSSTIRVGSYKGNSLEVGERSGLILGPSGTEYTVTSSAPDIVAVEQVLTFWVAVAKAEGTAEITATDSTGKSGAMTLTVGTASPAEISGEETISQMPNAEVRQELIRLINQTRAANGVSELPVNDALMNAAQTCSDRRYTWHHTKEECEAVIASGYPHGFGTNLTVFTGVAAKDTAQHALENWSSSSGHFETMIEPDCDGIGVGVTESGGVTYCYMFVGRPNTQNPYE